MKRTWFRQLALLFGHAPALWLLYREPLPKHLRRPNLIAVAATITLVALVVRSVAPRWKTPSGLLVWLGGHFLWGLYLVRHFERPRRTKTRGLEASRHRPHGAGADRARPRLGLGRSCRRPGACRTTHRV